MKKESHHTHWTCRRSPAAGWLAGWMEGDPLLSGKKKKERQATCTASFLGLHSHSALDPSFCDARLARRGMPLPPRLRHRHRYSFSARYAKVRTASRSVHAFASKLFASPVARQRCFFGPNPTLPYLARSPARPLARLLAAWCACLDCRSPAPPAILCVLSCPARPAIWFHPQITTSPPLLPSFFLPYHHHHNHHLSLSSPSFL